MVAVVVGLVLLPIVVRNLSDAHQSEYMSLGGYKSRQGECETRLDANTKALAIFIAVAIERRNRAT